MQTRKKQIEYRNEKHDTVRESKKANKFRFYFSSHSSQAITSLAGAIPVRQTKKYMCAINCGSIIAPRERALVPFDDFIPLQIIVIFIRLGLRPPSSDQNHRVSFSAEIPTRSHFHVAGCKKCADRQHFGVKKL